MSGLVAYWSTLLDYNYWARDRILAAVGQLSQADYEARRELDHPSLRATLTHVFGAEALWRQRWQGHGEAQSLTEADIPTLDALTRLWVLEQAKTRAFVQTLRAGDTERPIVFTSGQGSGYSEPLWQSFTQMITHGIQHRAELALVLTQLGHSPGFMDFLAFVRERGS